MTPITQQWHPELDSDNWRLGKPCWVIIASIARMPPPAYRTLGKFFSLHKGESLSLNLWLKLFKGDILPVYTIYLDFKIFFPDFCIFLEYNKEKWSIMCTIIPIERYYMPMFGWFWNCLRISLILGYHGYRKFLKFCDHEIICCVCSYKVPMHTPIFRSISQSSARLWQCGSHLELQNHENLINSTTSYKELPHKL